MGGGELVDFMAEGFSKLVGRGLRHLTMGRMGWSGLCNLIKDFMGGAEVFKFMRVWGKWVACSALIITYYNVCIFLRRWWRWGRESLLLGW